MHYLTFAYRLGLSEAWKMTRQQWNPERSHAPRATLAAVALAIMAASAPSAIRAQEKVDVATIDRIRTEEMQHSQIMDIMSWLTDVYGPRLTWSPNLARAAMWTTTQMKTWGLANVHEEPWTTPAGLGWQNERFSLMVTSPTTFIVEAVPQAWSVGTKGSLTGAAFLVDAACSDELKEKYAGKLKGAFLLTAPPRNRAVTAFTATGERYSDSALTVMANATPNAGRGGFGRFGGGATTLSPTCQRQATRDSIAAAAAGGAGRGGFGRRGGRGGLNVADTATMRWIQSQGVAAILLGDGTHTGGVVGTNNGASRVKGTAQVPTVHLAQESYGRIARILERKLPVTLELNMENKFFPENTASFNIIGEIPGTDPQLKNEVVMIGAHFDSWHSGTGATDNAAGSAVMLEAMRLLKTLGLSPRRTIRIGLWTGEEQGLYGSKAYTSQHYGIRDSSGFHPTDEQKEFAAYFNVDNGSGKIRGVYMQSIEAERPIFDAWMAPFKSMGMKTLTIENTTGTDHLSYIDVGLPGFQFIQDPLDYDPVTHHTNQDVYEHIQPDDMQFNSIVVASFAWQAAQRDEKLPRPPLPGRLGARTGGGR